MLGRRKLAELPAPAGAGSARQAEEVLRAWIVDGGLHVSLKRGFDDPAVWGIMLADIARHAARIYATEAAGTEAAALSAIKAMLDAEWARPTDPGSTQAMQQGGAIMADAALRGATYADLEAVPPHLVAEIIDGVLKTSRFDAISFPLDDLFPFDAPSAPET